MNLLLTVLVWTGRTVLAAIAATLVGYETAAAVSRIIAIPAAVACGGVVAVVLLATSIVGAARLKRFRWRVDTVNGLVVMLLLSWLAWDPAPTPTPEPLGPPIPPAAEPSREQVAQCFKGGPCEAWPKIYADGSELASLSLRKGAADEFLTTVEAHAEEIEEAWARAETARAWMAGINAFDEISDFAMRFDSPIPWFGNLRAITRVHTQRAALLALRGQGDDALDTLAPVAACAGRLRRGGRTLVTIMIGVVMEGSVMDAARVVLDRTQISVEAKARFAATLDDAVWDGRDLARALRVEHDMARTQVTSLARADFVDLMGALEGDTPAWARWVLSHWTATLLFNPNSFCRQHRAYMESVATYAESPDPAAILAAEAEIKALGSTLPAKNPAGAMLMQMMVPAFSKIDRNCRDRLEQRRQLVDELRR